MAAHKLLQKWRPSWARPFIIEYADQDAAAASRWNAWSTVFLLVLTVLGLGLQIATAIYAFSGLVLSIIWAICLVYVAVLRPRTGSLILTVLFTGILAAQLVLWTQRKAFDEKTSVQEGLSVASTVATLLAMFVMLNLPLRDPTLSREGISQAYADPSEKERSPEDNLTLFQWMTVSWMGPLMRIGSKRQINPDDVWFLGYEFQHTHLHHAFRELRGTVLGRLLRANWIDLVILTTLALVELCASYFPSLLLQQLLLAMKHLDVSKRPAIMYGVLILVLRIVAAQSAVFSLWYGRRAYERTRGEMITMLYEKTLHRKIVGAVQAEETTESGKPPDAVPASLDETQQESNEAAQENQGLLDGQVKEEHSFAKNIVRHWSRVRKAWSFAFGKAPDADKKVSASTGKILNIMRNDVYEVAQRFWEFQNLVNKPIGLILSVVLTWQLLGWPCLVGLAVVVVAQLLYALMARVQVRMITKCRKATDAKLQHITQFVEAIRHLRWYGWQPTWLERVISARQHELNRLVVMNAWFHIMSTVNRLGSGLLSVVAFWVYTEVAGQQLTVDVAFPALQLFQLAQMNLRELPRLVTSLLNAWVAVGRIEDFMSEPDKDEDDSDGPSTDDRLELEHASFAWPGATSNVLHDINLSFQPGLTVIHGEVAAGKSALLQALLGELDVHDGQLIRTSEPVAYCSQRPWLQSMTIRENILFGSPYEDARYKQCLEACALTTDLASFEHGDLSPIGENGIGLSGGQKARTALARAVYSRAYTLLLDDPLSALDQQTAEHIVTRCLGGELLKGRRVILVTHRTDLCRDMADQLIEIVKGRASVQTPGTKDDADSTTTIASPIAANGHVDKTLKEAEEAAAVPEKFEEEEHRAHGGVQFQVYWEYFKAGKPVFWFFTILCVALVRTVYVAESWFIKEWGEAYHESVNQIFVYFTDVIRTQAETSPISRFFERFPDPNNNPKPWVMGYFAIIMIEVVLMFSTDMFMLAVTYSTGKTMFIKIMDSVTQATFRFYDVTPIGRLMNRLTSDIGTIDGNVPNHFLIMSWLVIAWISSITVIASVTPVFLAFAVILTAAFVFVFLQFLPTSQSLRRLEMVSLSPLMSNFGALLEGLTTVRAFCAQTQFQRRVIEVTDAFQRMDHFYWSLQAWLMYRFDILSACSTLILTVLAIYSELTPGLTAFVLTAAAKFVQVTHGLCKTYGALQLEFVSVERIVELIQLDQEPPGTIDPPAWWPSTSDDIVFEDVTVRYAPHLDPAIKNVSFTLPGGSNTAVIGRTGSGKSTLALTLLATIVPESGRILIGGIDIAKVNKQTLRTRLTFLAQDPVLFPGSLRHNLDPTDEHSDEDCKAVIARVAGSYNWTLDTEIDTGGKNLSQGQRQLVGLARAILRRSSIIIMDEATASIDQATAWEIQRVLREEMKHSTVVTIAHRSAAVRGAGLVVRLAGGLLVGFGPPEEEDAEMADIKDREGAASGSGSGSTGSRSTNEE